MARVPVHPSPTVDEYDHRQRCVVFRGKVQIERQRSISAVRRVGHIGKTGDTTGENRATFRIGIFQLWAGADRGLVQPRARMRGAQE